ncbi:MAG: NrdH-redoxin [Dehalococcoidia bacterium]|nr:NrdH-redoxin [Dehalococcoidia bacterium]
MSDVIKIYGTAWCPDCILAKQILKQHSVIYEWIDISGNHEAAVYVEKINNGNRSVPTIVFPDGSILTEPSKAVLEKKLETLRELKINYPSA